MDKGTEWEQEIQVERGKISQGKKYQKYHHALVCIFKHKSILGLCGGIQNGTHPRMGLEG